MTGDVVVNPNAPIMVMTTEILRSMLYRQALEAAGHLLISQGTPLKSKFVIQPLDKRLLDKQRITESD